MILHLPQLIDLNTYINAERRNRFIAAKLKRDMTQLVAQECVAQALGHFSVITVFNLEWHHKNRRKDFDNVEFGVKWIKDGMVSAGVIDNDGWSYFPTKTVHHHSLTGKSGVDVIIEGER